MNSRGIAKTVGILYIAGTVAGALSASFLGVLYTPDFLINTAQNRSSVVIGAIFVLIMGLALAMIPAFMFPILKKVHEPFAVGYVIFRGALESFTYLYQAIGFLLLSSLSAEYVKASAQDGAYIQTLGTLLKEMVNLPITVFVFGIGALLFYAMLFKARLIPRWITAFGVLAILLHMVSGVLLLFGIHGHFDPSSTVMAIPIAVQEMIMAIWLILKGFQGEAHTGSISR